MSTAYPHADFRPLLTHLAAEGSLVPDSEASERITADPDDDKFMRCARVAGAVVVSGDRHLIAADGWNGVRVQTPNALLTSLADQDPGAT